MPLPPAVTLRVLEPLIPYPGRAPRRRLFRCSLTSRTVPSDRGSWSCTLPAATYDLAVGAEGFVPQRRLGVEILPGREREMGSFVLDPSQSIGGWLAIDEGIFDPQSFLLRVVPPVDAADPGLPVYQGDPLLVERTVRSDGSFRITNVRPGTWTVEARSPGFAPSLRTAVVVEPGKSTILREPLLLRRPFDLEVAIEPPADWRGRPWELWVGAAQELAGAKPKVAPQKVRALDPPGSGLFRVPDQVPGRFTFSVTDADGSLLARREGVEIADRSEARQTIRISRLAVEGTVTRGGKAEEGEIYLEDLQGKAFLRSKSGPDGRFAGWLTHPGLWAGTFYRDESHISHFRFEVPDPPPDPVVVDVRLPDTRVFGRIEDEQGMPLRPAEVRYRAQGQSGLLRLDDDGTFNGEGLPPGPVWLRADTPPFVDWKPYPVRTSDLVEVELKDGEQVGPVVLRLRPSAPLDGRVTVKGGGAPPKRVWLEAVMEDGFSLSAGMEEETGRYSFVVPGGEEKITLLLMPEDGPLRAVELSPHSAPSPVRLDDAGGTLQVDLGRIWGQARAQGKTLEVEQDGVLIPLDRLLYWGGPAGGDLGGSSDSLKIPALAPGHYRVCLGPEGFHERIDPAARSQGSLDCDSGTLPAGGELRLSLP